MQYTEHCLADIAAWVRWCCSMGSWVVATIQGEHFFGDLLCDETEGWCYVCNEHHAGVRIGQFEWDDDSDTFPYLWHAHCTCYMFQCWLNYWWFMKTCVVCVVHFTCNMFDIWVSTLIFVPFLPSCCQGDGSDRGTMPLIQCFECKHAKRRMESILGATWMVLGTYWVDGPVQSITVWKEALGTHVYWLSYSRQ